jgi:AAA+ ATPase superfamily predicted ATPase
METNPFYTTSVIPAPFFCDREQETESIIRILTNGNNLVLKGPRRLGKSGLIHHIFEDKRICDHYNTFYFDIYATSTLEEFTLLLGRAVYASLASRKKKAADAFLSLLRSLSLKVGMDPVSGALMPGLGFGDVKGNELTLNEIFDFLEKSDTPNIVAIDEFQQIQHYSQENMAALLRTRIQKMNNTKFIFSGSERHMLDIMFASQDNPFFKSARNVDIAPIPEDVYCDFARRLFLQYGKQADEDAVLYVYHLFDGVTYYMQETMNEAFSLLREGDTLTRGVAESIVDRLVESNTSRCLDILDDLTLIQRRALGAIAKEWRVADLTSSAFISKYRLSSASSVQSATRALIKKKLVVRERSTYFLQDKYLALWLKANY